jgi:hypothetical protein
MENVLSYYNYPVLKFLQEKFTEDELLFCSNGREHFTPPINREEAIRNSETVEKYLDSLIDYFGVRDSEGNVVSFNKPSDKIEARLMAGALPIWNLNHAWECPVVFMPFTTMVMVSGSTNFLAIKKDVLNFYEEICI